MPSLTITEAFDIIDTHNTLGIDGLWSNYSHLETIGCVRALYELAWTTVEDGE